MVIIRPKEESSADEGVEKREILYVVGENVNQCYPCEKQYEVSSKKLSVEILYVLVT